MKESSFDVSTRIGALKHGQASSKPSGTSSKPRGPIIRLCGCCGTERDISQRSLSPGYGLTCVASSRENYWRKVYRASKS